MPDPIVAIVFDFDGVIADTERLHLAAFREVFAARGWHLEESAYVERYLGCDDEGLVAAYARDQKLALADSDLRALTDAKVSAFSRHLTSANVLFPAAKPTLVRLAERFRFGIASGALHHEIESILRTGGLLDLFPVIVGADDVEACKPSPVPYLAAARALSVEPAACVAVEDSAPGLQAARSAGMRTIAVMTTSPRSALGEADLIVAQLRDLSPEVVAALGAPRPL